MGDARDEARGLAERAKWKESYQPEAGDRDRFVRSTRAGMQSAAREREMKLLNIEKRGTVSDIVRG